MPQSWAQITAKKPKASQKPPKGQNRFSYKISQLQRRYDEALSAAEAKGHQCGEICEDSPYGCIMVGFGEVSLKNCRIAVDRRGDDESQ